MTLTDFPLLTDENIDPEVVSYLRSRGFDVCDVVAEGWLGASDQELLSRATAEGRIVLTHDSDFGTLAVLGGQPLVGVIYLRPGHIDAAFTIATIEAVLDSNPQLTPPFLLVARRHGTQVTIRVRRL